MFSIEGTQIFDLLKESPYPSTFRFPPLNIPERFRDVFVFMNSLNIECATMSITVSDKTRYERAQSRSLPFCSHQSISDGDVLCQVLAIYSPAAPLSVATDLLLWGVRSLRGLQKQRGAEDKN